MTDSINHSRGRFARGGLSLPPAELPDPRLAESDSVYQDAAGQYWRLGRTMAGRRAEREAVQYWTRVTPIQARRHRDIENAKTALGLLAGVAASFFLFARFTSGWSAMFQNPFDTAVTLGLVVTAAAYVALTVYLDRTVKVSETEYREWCVEQRELARVRRGLPSIDQAPVGDLSAGGDS